MDESRLESVRGRLAASHALEAAVRRAIAEGTVPEAAAARIPEGVPARLEADREPLESVVPLDALEAIVQRVGRPPLLVRNATVELEPLVDFPADVDVRIKAVEPAVRSVGRVEFVNHRMAWGGTGWVIEEDGDARVVATNRHVASLVARRLADGRGIFLRSPATGARYGADIDFAEEVGSVASQAVPVAVSDVLFVADDAAPDVAFLRIRGRDLPDPLPLADDEAGAGDVVALIGYPAFDERNDPHDQARYFRDIYGVKRFMPGKVMQALTGRTVLSHDCTSLGGASGSPLIRLEDRKVVGLHYAGVYGVANSAVGVRTLGQLLRSRGRVAVSGVRLIADGQAEATDGTHGPDDLRDRRGYEVAFLGEGTTAPWPGLPEHVRGDLARPADETSDQPGEVRYTHFGVRFSTSRRQPVMTAVNIDGRHSVRVKRGRDRWFVDGRLPEEIQLTREHYREPEIDRGHMVRREDPNWDVEAPAGQSSAVADQANLDTFHYTNAAPQHADLNQGRTLWLGLEDHILDNARTRGFRACVFTGPVVRDDDPDIGDGVLVPREFWKVVVMLDADRDALHATAYLLSQGDLIRDLLEDRGRTETLEGFVLGPYRTFQISIADLAEGTGYDFTAYLDADPLSAGRSAEESADPDQPVVVPLETLEDVRT
ncbi:DNA/RNA non-specific endonuclease [Blastococcus sp. BMG 814]|uniref:DNA/RNA non-specific endonuclease n=1 Tax=Blastococcus carthaginiensis TaxID=3050034 RepID=A0ABT9I7R8_9ACTN|nr:DNA/RNA non-specific endonuclease [Blastococcus carthaginiensis]MDP5181594.1 DNA/RNA non-specific endonuclease [Blastococcus carthaginiensis]